jgi:hypothetical protein
MATPISAVVGEKDLRIRIEEAVMKASKNKAVPPKHKHERNILLILFWRYRIRMKI